MGTPQTFLRFFFPNDPSMLLQGSLMLRIFYPSFIILSMGLGLAVVFSGSGHTRPILYSTLGSRWFVQIPFLFLVVNILHLPLFMVWTSYILSEIAEFSVIFYHYLLCRLSRNHPVIFTKRIQFDFMRFTFCRS